jgi:hypothetical protein
VDSLADTLSGEDRVFLHRLIDHNEAGEALTSLAWMVVDGNKTISASAMNEFHRLADGLVSAEFMPPNFDSHVTERI